MRRTRRAWAPLLALSLIGCPAGTDDPSRPEYGPPDAMLGFDAAAIPLVDASPRDATTADAIVDTGLPGDTSVVPEAAAPECSGSPTPCGALSSYSCSSTRGCYAGGTCTGVSSLCSWQTSSYSCNDLQGCYWSYSSNSCSGFSWPCSDFSSSSSCVSQSGCSWRSDCEGSATPCGLLDQFSCTTQPGCSWQ